MRMTPSTRRRTIAALLVAAALLAITACQSPTDPTQARACAYALPPELADKLDVVTYPCSVEQYNELVQGGPRTLLTINERYGLRDAWELRADQCTLHRPYLWNQRAEHPPVTNDEKYDAAQWYLGARRSFAGDPPMHRVAVGCGD